MTGVEAERSVSAEKIGIPDRLTRDPRIRTMYKRLLRRRPDGAFVYSARFDWAPGSRSFNLQREIRDALVNEKMDELPQKFAIYSLFFGAHQCALSPARVVLRSDLERECKRLLSAAEIMSSSLIVPLERQLSTLSEDESETLLARRAGVKELERKAETLEEGCIVVQRNRGRMEDLAVIPEP